MNKAENRLGNKKLKRRSKFVWFDLVCTLICRPEVLLFTSGILELKLTVQK